MRERQLQRSKKIRYRNSHLKNAHEAKRFAISCMPLSSSCGFFCAGADIEPASEAASDLATEAAEALLGMAFTALCVNL